jgi:GTPase SAR1 family protein
MHPSHVSTTRRLSPPQGPASPLDLRICILVIGLAGSGKTQLIRSLLGGPLADDREASSSSGGAVDAFEGATTKVEVRARGGVCA